jgi:predicted amidohydrolase
MDQFRVALAQLSPTLFDKRENLAKAEEAIRLAASRDAAVILFPELFLTGYSLGDHTVEMAEEDDGPSIRYVAELAGLHHIAVLMGYAELSPNGRQAFDAVFVADPKGKISGSYRKIHLFHDEATRFIPGDQPLIIDFGFGRFGVLICYDLEFPESVRDLALRGAQWVATCTGNMSPNQHIQEIFVQSRAAENRIWVAVANRVGHESNLDFFGGSAVASPTGELTVHADEHETILFADIDLNLSDQARLNADYLGDRRPELYHFLKSS